MITERLSLIVVYLRFLICLNVNVGVCAKTHYGRKWKVSVFGPHPCIAWDGMSFVGIWKEVHLA